VVSDVAKDRVAVIFKRKQADKKKRKRLGLLSLEDEVTMILRNV
jgi:hypothetical protein